MQVKLQPHRWHLPTWFAFLLWLLFAVIANVPPNVTYESLSGLTDDSSVGTQAPIAYSSTMMIGWPFTYQEHTVTATSTNVATSTYPYWLIGNIVVISIVQICVVYSFQQFGRFSVRTMLLGTLLVALVIFVGQFLSNAFPFRGVYYYIHLIYYAPAIFTVLCFISKRRPLRRMMTEHKGL